MSTGPLRLLQPLGDDGPFSVFADQLLRTELPDLPDDRRCETVGFVCRRARALPSPLLLGISTLAVALGITLRVCGAARVTSFLRATHLPLVGELARLVRSLGFAFVWESWPDTSPLGAPVAEATT